MSVICPFTQIKQDFLRPFQRKSRDDYIATTFDSVVDDTVELFDGRL